MSVNGKIAEYILRAQNASDGGKYITDLSKGSQKAFADNKAGYAFKDTAIISAMNLINCGKSNWKYAVHTCGDYSRKAWIVYFETHVGRKKIQISFHTFNERFNKYVRNSYRMKWDRGDSRESALIAYRYYNNNGKYA